MLLNLPEIAGIVMNSTYQVVILGQTIVQEMLADLTKHMSPATNCKNICF